LLGGDVGGVDGFFVLREDAASGPLDQVPEGVGDDEVRVEVTEEDGGFSGVVAVHDDGVVGVCVGEVAEPGGGDQFVSPVGDACRGYKVVDAGAPRLPCAARVLVEDGLDGHALRLSKLGREYRRKWHPGQSVA